MKQTSLTWGPKSTSLLRNGLPDYFLNKWIIKKKQTLKDGK